MLGVALQIVVPPIMLALLFEEVVTVAGLHEGSSSLISGGLGLVGGYDRDGECHQLASCVQSGWLPILICCGMLFHAFGAVTPKRLAEKTVI